MAIDPVCIGVIGAGDISPVYLAAIARSSVVTLRKIATRNRDKAQVMATPYGATGATVAELLADDAIEMVVNLTPGSAHEEINRAAIEAGKHVYSEKPFALSRKMAEALAERAEERGVLIGSAPDTFYGSAHQAARRALDSGAIGRPVFGTSLVGLPGLEHFHPNPAAFYQPGGEPPFDVGPYYITMWLHLLGPVRRVFATSESGQAQRTIRRGPLEGTSFAVEVDTTFNTTLEFETGFVNLTMSLDVVAPIQRPGELYGAQGILSLADPNFFSGEPSLLRPGEGRSPLPGHDLPFSQPNRLNHAGQPVADYRGVGLTDLSLAVRHGHQHRTAPDFMVHAVEVMEAIAQSARIGQSIAMQTQCRRPAPIDPVADADLIALTPSPFDLVNVAPQAKPHLTRLDADAS
ncbi:Gfo/Idh/MocA family oxidoreductase [Novosphingobium sp. SG720]|uniref:Gfo/Idh/MocA family protein n=1 Tax=Novosphingobium sp. SG720 TaxID=2586998 RepID=UPI00144796BB|nr:Gfo/Idh/MocA family oxidoreductase [Novosphingobium sp. SG720]NKJ45075.1 putative dehydrogenase [Novosphingobium sp. SG720]